MRIWVLILLICLMANSSYANTIKAIEFNHLKDQSGQFTLLANQENINYSFHKTKKNLEVIFPKAHFAKWLLHTFPVSQFGTIIQSFQAKNVNQRAILSIQIKSDYKTQIKRQRNALQLRILAKPKKQFVPQTVTLNFQKIPTRAALQQLAQIGNVNMVIEDSVNGEVSLHLQNVNWKQALSIILQTQGLASKKVGNVYIIGTAEQIAKQEQAELTAQQKIASLEPLQSQLIRINYGKAADIAKLLRSAKERLLSKRGSVSVDERTNTLWVQDIPAKLTTVEKFVRKLDHPVKQVLIEARIVNLDRSYEKQLGIRWGISHYNGLSGTLAGANQLASGQGLSNIDVANRLNLDLPAAGVGQIGGAASFGVAMAKLGSGYMLDLELSALQNDGVAKILSKPRLVTANQQQAVIESGEEIPFQRATLSGATAVAFKKAVLSLKVTPHITPDNRIILQLKVNQDKRGPEVLAGVPTIDTREIETRVLVNNGQTLVLGGILQKSDNNQTTRVPFLGDLPIIGHFFRSKHEQKKQSELLIFITPKILKE